MTSPFQNVMVGLAGHGADAELIRYVRDLVAVMRPRGLHFVHALSDGQAGGNAPLSFEAAKEMIRRDIHAHFGEGPSGLLIADHVVRGQRVDTLLEFAAGHGTDLIVVGHRRSRSGRRSLARRLAMKAPCSVWSAPEGSTPRFDRVLAPIDFSAPAADALGVATSIAAAAGASECLALHVYFNEAVTVYDGYDAVIRGRETEAFERFIAPIDRNGVRVRPIFEEAANVAHAIQRVAARDSINLVVMGTRGRSPSAAVLLGSETEHTIIESQIPVLAVKHFGARINILQALLDKRFLNKSAHLHGVL